jgi:DNA-binding LacI/PurR family transcriptional regulator
MPVTHEQIAKLAGVSRAIVTQALHGTPGLRVSEETQRNIERIARELGYVPRNVTTRNIGLVMSLRLLRVQTDFNFICHVERMLRERGYRLVLISPELPAGQNLGDLLNTKTVDGLLLGTWDSGRYESLVAQRLPCILLTEEDDAPGTVEQIGIDLRGTMLNIFGYLHGRGHRRIALLSSVQRSSRFYRRIEQAAQMAAPNDVTVEIVNSLPEFCAEEVSKLVRRTSGPTAVIVPDVERVLMLNAGLRGAGIRVPEEVSVVSLFDYDVLADLTPPITATTAGGSTLAERAIARLLQKINVPETVPHHVFVPGEIVERASVSGHA